MVAQVGNPSTQEYEVSLAYICHISTFPTQHISTHMHFMHTRTHIHIFTEPFLRFFIRFNLHILPSRLELKFHLLRNYTNLEETICLIYFHTATLHTWHHKQLCLSYISPWVRMVR